MTSKPDTLLVGIIKPYNFYYWHLLKPQGICPPLKSSVVFSVLIGPKKSRQQFLILTILKCLANLSPTHIKIGISSKHPIRPWQSKSIYQIDFTELSRLLDLLRLGQVPGSSGKLWRLTLSAISMNLDGSAKNAFHNNATFGCAFILN